MIADVFLGMELVIGGIFNKGKYVEIMLDVLLPWAEENMLVIRTYQQDMVPKHTARLTKQFFDTW